MGFAPWGQPAYAPQYAPQYMPPYAPYGTAPTAEQELDVLRSQAEYLTNALDEIRKRITALEAEKSQQ